MTRDELRKKAFDIRRAWYLKEDGVELDDAIYNALLSVQSAQREEDARIAETTGGIDPGEWCGCRPKIAAAIRAQGEKS